MPPPPKKKKGLWIVLGIGAVLLLCCIGGVVVLVSVNSDKDTDDAKPTAISSASGAVPAAPGIGTAVRDGKFEFVVKKVECGQAQVGADFLEKKAQGQFCLVTLSVKNIGDKPQSMYDGNQKGYGANNTRYAPDSTAGIYANADNAQVWAAEINPGNEVSGVLVFDIPKDGQLTSLELHDSPFSNGVKVKLQ